MPIAIPIAGAVAAAGAATATIAAVFTIVSTVLYGIVSAQQQRREQRRALEAGRRDLTFMVRSAEEFHRVVYGESRISGPIAFTHSTGADNGQLYVVLPLTGHEVAEILEIIFNETNIGVTSGQVLNGSSYFNQALKQFEHALFDANGNPTLTYVDNVGVQNVALNSILQATIPNVGTLASVVAIYNAADQVSPTGVEFFGRTALQYTLSGNVATITTPGAFVGMLVEVQWSEWVGNALVAVESYRGTTTQLANGELIAATGNRRWTDAHRGLGRAYIMARLFWDYAHFLAGIPNISARVLGNVVEDLRNPGGQSVATGDNTGGAVRAVGSKQTSGKYYFEVAYAGASSAGTDRSPAIGVATADVALTGVPGFAAAPTGEGWTVDSNQNAYNAGGVVAVVSGLSPIHGHVIGVAVDIGAQKMWVSRDGVWLNSGNPVAGTAPIFSNVSNTEALYPVLWYKQAGGGSQGFATLRTVAGDFASAPPSGFLPWEKIANGWNPNDKHSSIVLSGTTYSTTMWSSNPALCIRHYLLNTAFGLKALPEQIDEDSFIAAANICDEYIEVDTATTAISTQWQAVLDQGVIDGTWERLTSPAVGEYARDWNDGSLAGQIALGSGVTQSVVSGVFNLTSPNLVVGISKLEFIPAHGDAIVEFDVRVPTIGENSGNPGFVFATTWWTTPTAQSYGYEVQIRNVGVYLAKGSNSGAIPFATILATTGHGASPGAFCRVRIEHSRNSAGGKQIVIKVNGVTKITYTDSASPWLFGQVGFRNFSTPGSSAEFDNFSLVPSLGALYRQRRYTCNGAFTLDRTPEDILSNMLTSCAGTLSYTGGVFRLVVGAYQVPTLTFDESDMRGDIVVVPKKPRRELFNKVRGLYASRSTFDQSTDFPPVTDPAYVTADGGKEYDTDLLLNFTNDVTAAQRIAQIHLRKHRSGRTMRLPFKLNDKSIKLRPGDTFMLDNTRFGYSSKVVRVEDWTFRCDDDFGIDVLAQEESASNYDWDLSDANIDESTPLPVAGDAPPIAARAIQSAQLSAALAAYRARGNDAQVAAVAAIQPQDKVPV